MRMLGVAGAWLLVLVLQVAPAAAGEPPALIKARALYNAADYQGAIDLASVARQDPQWADVAALVIARAHLERHRLNPTANELSAARSALAAVRSAALTPRDQIDQLIGLGQLLYLSDIFGAAAELFDTALGRGTLMTAADQLRLLDWWATALDREAQTRAPERRTPVYTRMLERMQSELHENPANPVANYWLVVSARGTGDLDRAWSAAVAAWVRSSLAPATADNLRADLDRLVTQALIPERVRTRSPREQADAATAALRADWEQVKQQWK